jgi:F0F1-type ATP synthase membrane subunit b/b'
MELNITFLFEMIVISIIIQYLSFSVFQPLSKLSSERERQTSGKKLEIKKMMEEISKQKAYINEQMDSKLIELYESNKKSRDFCFNEQKKILESQKLACQEKYDAAMNQIQSELQNASENLKSKKHLLAGMIYDKLHKK